MAGVSDANLKKKSEFKGLRQLHDGELRRFNILSRYRGYKISNLLYNKILEYAKIKQYKRFILTTSSFQYTAFTYVYPSWGFKKLKELSFLDNKLQIAFFAKNL
jgi:GNAT superfamily N-acetyltransferase